MPGLILFHGGGWSGGHISAIATMNPGLNDPADPKDIDTSVVAYEKWKSLGVDSIDLIIAPGQAHSFFNKEPWRTVTLIAADRFLAKHGFISGKPTLKIPASGEKLVPSH